jgi:IPT/TIG domain
VRSPRVLTAVTPPHAAGSAAISVRTKAGVSRPSKARFHYLKRPRLAGLSRHSGLVTGGQVVTISGHSLSYVTGVMFGGLHAVVLPRSTNTTVRVRTPASWAGTVQVSVQTLGGATASSVNDRFSFRNPAPRLAGKVTPASGDVVASGSDVTAVSGGPAFGQGARQAPWVVTLASGVQLPTVGQQFLLKPGGSVYPAGLAGKVTAADSATNTITVSPPSGSLDAAVASAQAIFTGPLGDGAQGSATARLGSGPAGAISFGSIPGTALKCTGTTGVTGGVSLTLDDVEAHVEVDTGSSLRTPFVDVWLSYQPTLAFTLTAEAKAQCSLPAAWQNTHQKLILLGDTGATIAIAPDVSFSVSAGGSVSFQQHSYRIMGFITNPDGSISRLDGQSSDPAQVKVSGQLTAEAYGGVQVQVGELNVIGAGCRSVGEPPRPHRQTGHRRYA